jgi:hypothetical protein
MRSDEYLDLAKRSFEISQRECDPILRSEIEDVAAAFQFMADYTAGLNGSVLLQTLHYISHCAFL